LDIFLLILLSGVFATPSEMTAHWAEGMKGKYLSRASTRGFATRSRVRPYVRAV